MVVKSRKPRNCNILSLDDHIEFAHSHHKSIISGRAAAFEVMIATNAVRTLIRDAKPHQIQNAIFTGAEFGMQTMDSSITQPYKKGIISKQSALFYASNVAALGRDIE